MNANKYGVISAVLGAILFFGTYFLSFANAAPIGAAGWAGVLLVLFYGGLLWLGLFFLLVGILMLLL
ncbi:hypothetical protein J4220_00880 [Candidatus Micrarchaeota archaeon]|nr:hypothetical protein [Candidatus Micrarchaeota archaeon]